jgi:Flp pilus assembly protein TadG
MNATCDFRRVCRRAPQRRGTAVVEFALIAPLFLLLLFGIIEFGRVVMVQQLITNAAREGARMAVIEGANDSTIETDIEDRLAGSSVPGATCSISLTADPVNGDRKVVTVSVPFNQVSWLSVPMLPMTPETLTSQCVMRMETVQ